MNEEQERLCLQLLDLVRELDAELDGVKIPASAAAIMNGIRRVINDLDYET